MVKQADNTHNHRSIESFERNPQLFGGKLFVLGPVEIQLLRASVGGGFNVVNLLFTIDNSATLL